MNKPYSSTILVFCNIILMGLGLYCVFLRPSLLFEDLRYVDASLAEIQAAVPELLKWLQKVFWVATEGVLGGYSFTSGLLTLYVAITAFRTRASGAP